MSIARATVAVHRFGLGAAPGDLDRVAPDPDGWVAGQLAAPRADAPELEGFPSGGERLAEFRALRAARRGGDMDALKAFRRRAAESFRVETEARLRRAVAAPQPLVERLAWFWSNHFTVSVQKPQILSLAGPFEREAIRPHLLGRFEDMLLAVARHPAMLIYLDNAQSIGPGSRFGQRRGLGLNENLAREIMELHTLGVDGGYGQADVEALARILTGWGVAMDERDGPAGDGFAFHPRAHEPGAKTLLGRRYAEAGMAEGEAALRDIARHPATARFVAGKLVRHFVADRPEPADVAAVARRFEETGGDLRAVTSTVLALPAAWNPGRAKLRTPQELAVATARAVGMAEAPRTDPARSPLLRACRLLGHLPFGAPSPAGYADVAEAWAGPDALLNRVEWLDGTVGAAPVARDEGTSPQDFARSILGDRLSSATLQAIARAPSRRAGISLALASPEFQWR